MKKKVDYRVLVTKKILREALTELMKEKSIYAISVTELCARAGINRSTFYLHYLDLEDLLRQIEDEMMEELRGILKQTVASGSMGGSAFYKALFSFFKKNADMCQVLLGENGNSYFLAQLVRLGYEMSNQIYRGQNQNLTDHEIEIFYSFVASGCIGLLRRWFSGELQEPEDAVLRGMETMVHSCEMYLKNYGR